MDIVNETEELARLGMEDVRSYFTGEETDDAENQGTRVDRALKLLGVYSRIRATRANEAGIAVSIAKMSNISGEALRPMFETLTGQRALPSLGEQPSGEEPQGEQAA